MKLWERRKDESSKAYAAFCHYRNLPPTERSLDKAYHAYLSAKRGGQQKGNTKKAPGRWTDWSTKYQWVERAQAYDTHNARVAAVRAARLRQADLQKFVDAEFNLALAMQNLTSKKMAYYIKQPIEAVDNGELRQLGLAYDLSRGWFKELVGFMDAEFDRLQEQVLTDESSADILAELDAQEVN